MTGSRVYWFAAVALATFLIGCGSAPTATSQSGAPSTAGGSAQPPAQAASPLTADVTFSGGLSGTLALNTVESHCELLPSGQLSATFDGVVPGSEAGFNVLEPPGTNSLVAGDEVGVNTSVDFWHSDTSGTATITVAGNTATGMVTAVIAGQTGSGVNGTVADLHVSASFSCPVSGSGG
jgi:hypothetical protein